MNAEQPPSWPNRVADRALPAPIESALAEARACNFSDHDRAVALAERAVAAARAAAEPKVLARTLYVAASVLRHARRPDRAFVLCLEVQPMFERQDERWRASCVVLLRGKCYLAVGEHERALELFTEAAERFGNLDDRAQLGRCYTSIAKAHVMGGDLRKAVTWAARSLATLDAERAPASLLRQLRNNEAYWRWSLGRELAEQGEPERAQAEFDRAAGLLPDLDALDPWRPQADGALILDTAITVHTVNRNLADAQRAMKQLASLARHSNRPFEKGLAWLRLADFRVMQGAPLQAIACARRALRHLHTLPLEPNRLKAQWLLAHLLEQTGDLPAAYAAHREAGAVEARQQKEAIAMRAELLSLDLEAEHELRKSAQTLEYAQRLSNVGHMVASINHELNQPMSSIKMLAEITTELIDIGQHEEAQANIEVMHRLSGRLLDLTSKLAAFPAQASDETTCVSVSQAVAEALSVLRSRLALTPCEIVQDLGDVQVHADEGQFVRVLANLLNNALDAMQDSPRRRVLLQAAAAEGQLELRITDSGPGLPDSVGERLFQPFFSTKAAGQGLGLGLALSREVVRRMHGELTAANHPEGGAVFCVSLPLAPR